MRTGMIGMGIMGRPMALNLLRAGHELTVCNRTPARCAEAVAAGAQQAATPADVARQCDVVITIVSDTPDVEEVLFSQHGVAAGLSPGTIVIDMSTISPSATEGFAERLAALGCPLLDAPVSGGDVGAQQGTLAIMVGGDEKAFQTCRPLFEAMGETIVHLGPAGSGQKTKMVNQLLGALHLVAMSEAMHLAREGGLDPHKVQSVVSRGAAGSWMLSNLAPRQLDGDYAPGFMIRLQQKDLRLAREWIEELNLQLPGSRLAFDRFTRALEEGHGDLGTQGLIRIYQDD